MRKKKKKRSDNKAKWETIRTRYCVDRVPLKSLSRIYHVSYQTIKNRASKEKWTDQIAIDTYKDSLPDKSTMKGCVKRYLEDNPEPTSDLAFPKPSAFTSIKALIGRPPKYTPQHCIDLIEFFEAAEAWYDSPVTEYNKDGSVKREYMKQIAKPPPTLIDFAHKIGVTRPTLAKWADKYPEFSRAVEIAKERYEAILVENGLLGRYNGQFAIFVAKNKLGWVDKQNIDHTTAGKPIQDQYQGMQAAELKAVAERKAELLNAEEAVVFDADE